MFDTIEGYLSFEYDNLETKTVSKEEYIKFKVDLFDKLSRSDFKEHYAKRGSTYKRFITWRISNFLFQMYKRHSIFMGTRDYGSLTQ